MVTSNYLYRTYPKEPEGKLTKIRASLVCEPTLAGCARDIHLGKYVLLSKGEDMTGGRHRDSILSDAFEAVIGAIYLDQGIEVATKFIETYVFKDVENKVLFFDAKTNLQEIVQGEGKGKLKYVLIKEEGPDHEKTFTVEARLGDVVIGTGEGRSKKTAEQHAAFVDFTVNDVVMADYEKVLKDPHPPIIFVVSPISKPWYDKTPNAKVFGDFLCSKRQITDTLIPRNEVKLRLIQHPGGASKTPNAKVFGDFL